MKMLTVLVTMAALSIATIACQSEDSRVEDGIERIEMKLADIENRQIELAARQAALDAAIELVTQRIDRGDEGMGNLLGLLMMLWMMPAYSEVYSYSSDVLNPKELNELMEETAIEDFTEGLFGDNVIGPEDIGATEPEPGPEK